LIQDSGIKNVLQNGTSYQSLPLHHHRFLVPRSQTHLRLPARTRHTLRMHVTRRVDTRLDFRSLNMLRAQQGHSCVSTQSKTDKEGLDPNKEMFLVKNLDTHKMRKLQNQHNDDNRNAMIQGYEKTHIVEVLQRVWPQIILDDLRNLQPKKGILNPILGQHTAIIK
jgi:hypothetical protein